jgi:hypothetical protein
MVVQLKIRDLIQLLNHANEMAMVLGTISRVRGLGCMHHGI